MQYGAILCQVDLAAAEHGLDALAQAACLGELHEEADSLVGDAMFGVVEVEAHGLGRQPLPAFRIVSEELT
jgi:hypothetical protein